MRKNFLLAAAAAALLSACGIGAPAYPEFNETSYRIEGTTASVDNGAPVQTVIYRDGSKMRVETMLPNMGQATIVFDEATNAAYVLNPTGQSPTATTGTTTPAPQSTTTTTTPQGASTTTAGPAATTTTAPTTVAQAPATTQQVVGVAVRIEDANAPQPLETAWAALGAENARSTGKCEVAGENGHEWVNPDEDMAGATFEDYMREGVYEATQAVKAATGVDRMNAVGYCIGGTLLSATLAHMAKTGDTSIQSATFFAAQADFKLAGDLLIFSDDKAIGYLEEKMDQAGGVLDAQTMADTFNSLRSNDLVWNYVVDNYYVGKQPPPFDLLYWNADQTRMPKALHLFYLRKFYRDNALTEGKLDLLGEHLSLKDVTIPIFMQSSKEDHIAPAASVYRTALSWGGPVEYIIAGSGHIAGVINHPDAKKYQYWTNPNLATALEDWQAFAAEHPGSWWPHWNEWLTKISGPDVDARTPGDGELQPLGDAPGEYVKVRSSAA